MNRNGEGHRVLPRRIENCEYLAGTRVKHRRAAHADGAVPRMICVLRTPVIQVVTEAEPSSAANVTDQLSSVVVCFVSRMYLYG